MPKKEKGAESEKSEVKVKEKRRKRPVLKKGPDEAAKGDKAAETKKGGFPIVGIGASAGGVQALETFFAHMPTGTGLAFVIVQHLDPHHESLMNSLLTKETKMKVNDAQDGVRVEPNQVYIKPPGKDIFIKDQVLHLQEPGEKGVVRLPIDTFLRSLAEDQKDKAMCIILSGASNDGTLGAKAIKGEGGMVMVQEEEQAQYPRMPKSVIDSGLADIILPIEEMPEHLLRYVEHPLIAQEPEVSPEEEFEQNVWNILMIVRTNTGHDFSQYKRNTVIRRIQRRMALNQIEDIRDYHRFLRQSHSEVISLFKDLTIDVTSFFRDRGAFLTLKERIGAFLGTKEADSTFRVWVPGCATGEEAYSIAILMLETLEEMGKYVEIKIFGSDINSDAIESARTGFFPENIVADISEERLKRFFSKKGVRYHVDSKIRDMMVFAVHDVTRDPPFSNMDLISCRNMLIYMNMALQEKVLSILHYALRPGGILFLGTSESVGESANLFKPLDKKQKIYQSLDIGPEPMHFLRLTGFPRPEEAKPELRPGGRVLKAPKPRLEQLREVVQAAIVEKYSSPAVLLDSEANILYFHGTPGRYLSLPAGEANFNIFNMVSGELHFRLSQALEEMKRKRQSLSLKGVQVRHNDDFLSLDLVLTPIPSREKKIRFALLEFKEQKAEAIPAARESTEKEDDKDPAVADLEQRLHITRQELQATIEELETSNEELKSANEELQANNEEFQSTNEELESSREELQSTNEELETVNTELFKKNQDLMRVEDELKNIFAANEVGTLFLDNDLRVRRFTPAAKEVFNLQEERDIGRNIVDITSVLQYERLAEDARGALDRLTRKEINAKGKDGKRYVIRIVPYRTLENIIDGVVITFLNVTDLGKLQMTERDVQGFFYNAVASLWEPVLILDGQYRVFSANRAFYRAFKTSPNETIGRSVFELGERQWDIPELRQFLMKIIQGDHEFEGYEVEHDFPGIGRKKMSLRGRRVEGGDWHPAMILLGLKDITEKDC